MFDSCYNLNSFSEEFIIPQTVTACDAMFFACVNLTHIPFILSDNIQNTGYMFCNCQNLLDLNSSFVLSSAISFCAGMFIECKKLQNLPTNFKLKKVTYFNSMFENCIELNIDINSILDEEWSSFKSKNVYKMFYNCNKIHGTLNSDFLWNNNSVEWIDTTDCFTNCNNIDNYNNIPTIWGGVSSSTSSNSSSSSSSTSSNSSSSSSSTSSNSSFNINNYKLGTNYFKIDIKNTEYKGNNININKLQLTNMAQKLKYNRYNIYNNFDHIIYDFDLNVNFDDVCILHRINFINCFSGCVYDTTTNKLLYNAIIQLIKEDTIIYETRTYNDGCFYFECVLYGTYHLKCTADNYIDYNSIIVINDNTSCNIYIEMNKSNISGFVKDVDTDQLIPTCVVQLNQQTNYNSIAGTFVFENLISNKQYTLTASKENSDYIQIQQSTALINLLNQDISNIVLYLKYTPPQLIGTYFKSYGVVSNSNFYENSGEIPYTYPIEGLTGIGPFSSDVEIIAKGTLDDVFYVFEGTDPHALPYYNGPGTYENGRIFYTELNVSRHCCVEQNLGIIPANTIFSIMFVDTVQGQAVWQGTITITPKIIKSTLLNTDLEIPNDALPFYKYLKIYEAPQSNISNKTLINTFNINEVFSVTMKDDYNYYVYTSN